MLVQILIAAGTVLGLLIIGCLVGRQGQATLTREGSHDWFWKFGRLCAIADMLAVGWLWFVTFRINGGAPQSTDSAIASVVYVAVTALLVALCGPVSSEAEDRAWLLVMVLAFVGALVLAVQYQPELIRI